jgi:PAS domain S-box-containing protein
MLNNADSQARYDSDIGNGLQIFCPGALNILFNTIKLGLWEWNFSTDELFFDARCTIIAGYEVREPFKKIKKNLIYSKDLHIVRKQIEKYLAGKSAWYEAEFRMIRKDGTLIWVHEKGVITEWNKLGSPVLMTGMLQEVAPAHGIEKKIRREKLFKENERLRINTEILQKRIEETQQIGSALFNASPHINLLFNHSLRLINCSPVTAEYFGFSSKETFLAQFMQFIRTITLISAVPEDTLPYFRERLIYTVRYGYCTFDIKIQFQEKIIPLRGICKRIIFAGHSVISMYLNDLSALKNTRNMLVRQERQLKTVYTVVYLLLSASQEDFAGVLYESLKYLGQCVKADRVYIWRNVLMEEGLQSVKVSEWHTVHSFDREDQNRIRFFYDDYLPHWREKVSDGISLNKLTRDLESPLVPLYSTGNALAILVVPVIFKEKFWGFIGLENCTDERLFTRRDEILIKTSGALMAAAMDRHEPD